MYTSGVPRQHNAYGNFLIACTTSPTRGALAVGHASVKHAATVHIQRANRTRRLPKVHPMCTLGASSV